MQRRVFDVAIVGGGIVGCATAREVAKRNPRLSIVILEKERHLGKFDLEIVYSSQ
jgi:L-2-hydroxyglutarate oxidase LhgO